MTFCKYFSILTIACFFLFSLPVSAESEEEWVRYGNRLYSQGKYEEAIPYYNAAIEINPNYVRAWYNKGSALYALGRYEEALECYNKVLELDISHGLSVQYRQMTLAAIAEKEADSLPEDTSQLQNISVYDGPRVKWDVSMYGDYTYETFRDFKTFESIVDTENFDTELFCAAIFYTTNIERINEGGTPFEYYYSLECSAQLHAFDMATRFFYSHENPHDPQKKNPADRMAIFGITSGYPGENIAVAIVRPGDTYSSLAKSLLVQWMNSPGHRANILAEEFEFLGCGAALYCDSLDNNHPKVKCVQNFWGGFNY